jgi:hypothetical protein
MLIYDTNCLTLNEAIIDTPHLKLILYTHESGELVLMANLKQPPGKVFFTIDAVYLHHFYNDKINLQLLFEATASTMVTVLEGAEYKLYMRSDADIRLSEGENLFSELKKKNASDALTLNMHTINRLN